MISAFEGVMTGLLTLAAAGGIECKPQGLPPVQIAPSKSAIRYDLSKTQAELDGMEIDTVNPYGARRETHVGGLMSGEIRVEHQIGFVQERYDTLDQACLHYDSIAVNITINPTIYIAKENKPGTCRHHAILAHEKKHVEVDRIVVNKYSKRIAEALSFTLNKYGATFGPIPTAQIGPTQARLKSYIDEVIRSEVERMNAERKALQQQVDSFEEYERVRKLCP